MPHFPAQRHLRPRPASWPGAAHFSGFPPGAPPRAWLPWPPPRPVASFGRPWPWSTCAHRHNMPSWPWDTGGSRSLPCTTHRIHSPSRAGERRPSGYRVSRRDRRRWDASLYRSWTAPAVLPPGSRWAGSAAYSPAAPGARSPSVPKRKQFVLRAHFGRSAPNKSGSGAPG